MEPFKYYLLKDKKPIAVTDVIEWAKAYERLDRVVKQITLPNNVKVSTVFLGIDHGYNNSDPVLFETMIFGGEHDQYQERYSTWEEAEEGHQRAIEMVFQS